MVRRGRNSVFRRSFANVICYGRNCRHERSAETGRLIGLGQSRRSVMGYGEWMANESVHWTVVHEDEAGARCR
jgi:hypothetical protein